MNAGSRFSPSSPTARALLVIIAVLLGLLTLAIHNSPAPGIDTEFGGATVDIRADRAWVLLPGDCATITWDMVGTKTIYVDGHSKFGSGAMGYCPSVQATSLTFQIAAANGDQQNFALSIRYLPLELNKCLYLLGILNLLVLALYYLVTERICAPMRFELTHFLAGVALLMACLLCQTGSAFRIESLLEGLSNVFINPAWQALGLLLSGMIFIPLAAQSLQGLENRSREDFVAIGAFFLFMLLLYLPFGFDSVGHWEEWRIRAYLGKDQLGVWHELISRFWIAMPNALATYISPQSFVGHHLVNFLMFWGRSALFYCILRKLKMDPVFAFLTIILFLVYPVNTHLMSLRQLMINASVLWLMVAVLFCLEFVEHPSRLRLAGVWLATVLNIWSYESGYAILAVIPLLWWRRSPRWTWRNVNLTVIWYLFPIVKIVFLLLLNLDSRQFYGSDLVSDSVEPQGSALDSIAYYAGIIESVYLQTFWYGWREALSALSQSAWILPTIVTLTLTGGVAAYLALHANDKMFPPRRRISLGLLCGALFILPAVGVLMWLDKYSSDLWRMYIYVPIGGAIAVICLILLAASLIKNHQIRKAFIVGVCLMILFPALARLFAQHAHYVNNANNKAWVLLQIVEQAPAVDPDAYIILATEMLGTELRAKGVSEFR
ncbi:MAG: hypothetical protein OXG60_13130, partial [Chloroflexi bacterium]|nr:hypothetical protein [Chloroflexota bacterium]